MRREKTSPRQSHPIAAMDTSNGNTPLPEDMTKAPEGLVLPPKDIRGSYSAPLRAIIQLTVHIAIVEKTAGYVARNGHIFEGNSTTHMVTMVAKLTFN